MIGTIILFLAVLSVLVLVHEIGHFITARKFGCKVDEFGVGFPPKAMTITKRKGVEYTINWIPLGGFVKIKGESGENADEHDSFASKPAWQRFIILSAGVIMNFVLAAVLLSIGFMIGLPSAIDENLPAGARTYDEAIRIVTVVEGSPADEAGLLMGDTIASVNDRVFTNADEAREFIAAEAGEVNLMIERAGEFQELTIAPEYLEEQGYTGIGVGFMTTAFVSFPVHLAVWHGIETTVIFTREVFLALVDIVKNLVTGHGLAVDISGPVGIAVMTGEFARLGLVYLIQFTAILSINLAIINGLPFPALDGGRILFLAIEKVRGNKPVSERIEALVHNVGFILLMGVVVLITYRDFVRFGDQIWGTVKGFFGV
ncbi:MAG: RIP metalloprotease RseP [Candidatus Uhrbacteria bacterium]|nr:RIP metalloprotease RseP [Patescibacteria group bacterium]MBU1907081.1 RIP metalloprotease RseP [Patescibacteria group bacterium]